MAAPILFALPAVTSLASAASYENTVQPYIATFLQFPEALWGAVTGDAPLNALLALYVQTNPLVTIIAIAFGIMPIFFIASEVNRNWSQVDRAWSILPVIFTVHFALWNHLAGDPNQDFSRVDIAANVILIWGSRLTYNYWRKGGYQVGVEDYRWELIQKKIGSFAFFILNVTFISTGQILLLLAVASPAYVMLVAERVTGPAVTPVDLAFGGAILALIMTTGIADQQQWHYQNAKHAYIASAKPQPGYTNLELNRGFATRGLWAYSRHPNFTCEQGVWVTLYLWSCAVTGTTYHWAGVGALGYLLLFQGSTLVTEEISAGKYPEYSQYQRQVGKFIPIPGYSWDPLTAPSPAPKRRVEAKKTR